MSPSSSGALEDDDLATITAALESELLESQAPDPLAPDPGAEQSIDEVFAAFKEHVSQEVSSQDYRTHYDLGIGYKEMGLVDEAIAEFELAGGADELRLEVSIMLALCHRDQGRSERAIHHYQRAIESAAADPAAIVALRYELGEVLVQSGDADGALNTFREVQRSDPAYRDVESRIAELESQIQS